MDEQTKEYARRLMTSASVGSEPLDKLPITLPESKQDAAGKLLGYYGSVVQSRGLDMQMDDATVSKVEKVIKWMYDSRRRGLLLCGTLGNGKTTMLRSIKKFIGIRSAYMEAQGVYDYFRQNQMHLAISSGEVVLIDDLGAEPRTYNDFGEIRYPLTEFLMKRYNSNSTTIIATNLTLDQIEEIYGDRLKDRMKEMFAVITYLEPSYRK